MCTKNFKLSKLNSLTFDILNAMIKSRERLKWKNSMTLRNKLSVVSITHGQWPFNGFSTWWLLLRGEKNYWRFLWEEVLKKFLIPCISLDIVHEIAWNCGTAWSKITKKNYFVRNKNVLQWKFILFSNSSHYGLCPRYRGLMQQCVYSVSILIKELWILRNFSYMYVESSTKGEIIDYLQAYMKMAN